MKNEILNKKVCGWKNINEKEKNDIFKFNDEYIKFLNKSKTERLTAKNIVNKLTENGFVDINAVESIKNGDKLYMLNKNKSIYAAVIGSDKLSCGLNIIGSHIDSPRLDLKPNPLYEEGGFAYLKTHYYGGIKKYQWTAIPLCLYGVIVKPSGEKIEVSIGDNDNDPIFTITDLLPHLAIDQMDKKLRKAIEAEDLNVLVGSIPNNEDSVKESIMKLINEKYGINEIDFYSSELELVPAFKARSLGFDKSMVSSYGQDDRVCAYTSLMAFINSSNTKKTNVIIFSDKEEIGSMGNTGMSSDVFDYFINQLSNKKNENKPGMLNTIYYNSIMLSADVGAGVDPNYQGVSEMNNASKIGYGIELNKYTGSGGKYNSSDANAEYVAKIRKIFEENKIKYQVSELGKVDIGGGGTIAFILANKGIEVIDCGVPVISMHSPYEVTSKFDVYEAYKAYKAFYENKK